MESFVDSIVPAFGDTVISAAIEPTAPLVITIVLLAIGLTVIRQAIRTWNRLHI